MPTKKPTANRERVRQMSTLLQELLSASNEKPFGVAVPREEKGRVGACVCVNPSNGFSCKDPRAIYRGPFFDSTVWQVFEFRIRLLPGSRSDSNFSRLKELSGQGLLFGSTLCNLRLYFLRIVHGVLKGSIETEICRLVSRQRERHLLDRLRLSRRRAGRVRIDIARDELGSISFGYHDRWPVRAPFSRFTHVPIFWLHAPDVSCASVREKEALSGSWMSATTSVFKISDQSKYPRGIGTLYIHCTKVTCRYPKKKSYVAGR